jgi:hypothetical protein
MKEKIVDRKDITEETYLEILDKESHSHLIIEDKNGVLRWRENSSIRLLVDLRILNLNDVVMKFYDKGLSKNSEEFRQLYRDLGYSLSGYWEIFYWEVNNPDFDKYIYQGKL